MSNEQIALVRDLVTILASVGGVGAIVVVILAWQSPKLLEVFLSFVRGVIKDWRSKPKVEKPLKTQQISKPQ